jgi:hypothetical protein
MQTTGAGHQNSDADAARQELAARIAAARLSNISSAKWKWGDLSDDEREVHTVFAMTWLEGIESAGLTVTPAGSDRDDSGARTDLARVLAALCNGHVAGRGWDPCLVLESDPADDTAARLFMDVPRMPASETFPGHRGGLMSWPIRAADLPLFAGVRRRDRPPRKRVGTPEQQDAILDAFLAWAAQ